MTQEKKALSIVAVCLVIIAAGIFLLRDREPPVVVTRERLAALQASIETWSAANGGRVPESLAALGLPGDATRDHAGHDFHYRVADDGKTVTLVSYGADGKPGGSMFHADNEVTFTLEGGDAGAADAVNGDAKAPN